MSQFDSPLDNLRVASPCSADWDAMRGDERKRFCGDCKLNVYNLSGMTRYDAEHLLRMSEGRICVRYFKRPDGTILTQDCPVGWARVKKRLSIIATAAMSLVVTLFASIFVVSMFRRQFVRPEPLMGAIAISPTPTPKPKPSPTPVQVLGETGWVAGKREIPVEPRPATKTRRVLPVYPAS